MGPTSSLTGFADLSPGGSRGLLRGTDFTSVGLLARRLVWNRCVGTTVGRTARPARGDRSRTDSSERRLAARGVLLRLRAARHGGQVARESGAA